MNTGSCVICTKEREAVYGLLCLVHFERMGTMLRDIENEACHLDPCPSMAISMDSGHGGLASERSPVRLDVLVHTDHRRGTGKSETDDDANAAGSTLPILDVLHSWARIVREERGLTEPSTEIRMPDGGPSAWAPAQVTITGERDLLTRHLEWVAAQPWCDEAYTDLRTLLGQLRSVNGTAPEKPVGRCYLPSENGACDGPIWIDTVAGHAHCGRCRQTWDGPQLAGLKWELDEMRRPRTDDGYRMLTADEVAAKKGWKRGTVFVRAHRDGVPSVHGYYDDRQFRDKACA